MVERPVLTIDPVQFGAVCIGGTRVPADAVAGRVAAGDSVKGNYPVSVDSAGQAACVR